MHRISQIHYPANLHGIRSVRGLSFALLRQVLCKVHTAFLVFCFLLYGVCSRRAGRRSPSTELTLQRSHAVGARRNRFGFVIAEKLEAHLRLTGLIRLMRRSLFMISVRFFWARPNSYQVVTQAYGVDLFRLHSKVGYLGRCRD
jgi:hypothetical protein